MYLFLSLSPLSLSRKNSPFIKNCETRLIRGRKSIRVTQNMFLLFDTLLDLTFNPSNLMQAFFQGCAVYVTDVSDFKVSSKKLKISIFLYRTALKSAVVNLTSRYIHAHICRIRIRPSLARTNINTLTDVFYLKVLENKYPETYKFEGFAFMLRIG